MICPHCKEESFARKKNIMDGWKIVRTVEVCAFCGAELTSAAEKEKAALSKRNSSRLAALLGEELPEKVTLTGESDRDFCRNCVHFLVHPFKTVCDLDDAEHDPMGSCPHFTGKETHSK